MSGAGPTEVSMMKKRLVFAACCVVLMELALTQEEEIILSDADIAALTEAGLPASVVATKINASLPGFDISVDQLVALSKGGANGAVMEVRANVAKPSISQTSETHAPANESPSATPSSLKSAAPQAGEQLRRPEIPIAQSGDTFADALRDGGSGPEMVVIPAGSFRMGCVSGLDCSDHEKPVHTVTIPQPFAVSKYEITFEDYDRFLEDYVPLYESDDLGWGRGRRPAIGVEWYDAKQYVAWLSSQTAQQYRLLTEAEWEYAARAGSTTRFSWGNYIGRKRANCYGCASGRDIEYTALVGSFSANPLGLHDMHGNVWEWVEDCWNDSYVGAPSDGSAWLRGDCVDKRVLRGGSWYTHVEGIRSAYRRSFPPHFFHFSIGFRVARTLTP